VKFSQRRKLRKSGLGGGRSLGEGGQGLRKAKTKNVAETSPNEKNDKICPEEKESPRKCTASAGALEERPPARQVEPMRRKGIGDKVRIGGKEP